MISIINGRFFMEEGPEPGDMELQTLIDRETEEDEGVELQERAL